MILHKSLLCALPLTLALLTVSCQQNTPTASVVIERGPDREKIRQQNAAQAKAEAQAKAREEARQQKLAEQRQIVEKRAKQRQASIAASRTTFKSPDWREPVEPRTKRSTAPKYRVASRIKGKPGFVFNPYTYNEVDVRGYRGGSVVIDPLDPAGREHAFRLPK